MNKEDNIVKNPAVIDILTEEFDDFEEQVGKFREGKWNPVDFMIDFPTTSTEDFDDAAVVKLSDCVAKHMLRGLELSLEENSVMIYHREQTQDRVREDRRRLCVAAATGDAVHEELTGGTTVFISMASPGSPSLLEAREERRRAEQDEQLLANRIALLRQEEAKAWKKIQQTKERAEKILAA